MDSLDKYAEFYTGTAYISRTPVEWAAKTEKKGAGGMADGNVRPNAAKTADPAGAADTVGTADTAASECQLRYMGEALDLARAAAAEGEVPVGCVIVRDGVVVGRGRNRREARQSTLAHAEMEAIAEANRTLGTWRLDGCELYVTLEPCPMCAGAILNGRIRRVWYGARDQAMGACGGVMNLFLEDFPHAPAVVGKVRGGECRRLLSCFFAQMRAAPTPRDKTAGTAGRGTAGTGTAGRETVGTGTAGRGTIGTGTAENVAAPEWTAGDRHSGPSPRKGSGA